MNPLNDNNIRSDAKDRQKEVCSGHDAPGSADARKEEPLCKGRVSVHDLIDVDGYLYQWMHDFPVPTVCEPCKALAIQWAEKRCQELEAAEGVCRDKAERLRDRDAVRYRNSV